MHGIKHESLFNFEGFTQREGNAKRLKELHLVEEIWWSVPSKLRRWWFFLSIKKLFRISEMFLVVRARALSLSLSLWCAAHRTRHRRPTASKNWITPNLEKQKMNHDIWWKQFYDPLCAHPLVLVNLSDTWDISYIFIWINLTCWRCTFLLWVPITTEAIEWDVPIGECGSTWPVTPLPAVRCLRIEFFLLRPPGARYVTPRKRRDHRNHWKTPPTAGFCLGSWGAVCLYVNVTKQIHRYTYIV